MSNSTNYILKNLGAREELKSDAQTSGEESHPELNRGAEPNAPSMSAILANCLTKKDEYNHMPQS